MTCVGGFEQAATVRPAASGRRMRGLRPGANGVTHAKRAPWTSIAAVPVSWSRRGRGRISPWARGSGGIGPGPAPRARTGPRRGLAGTDLHLWTALGQLRRGGGSGQAPLARDPCLATRPPGAVWQVRRPIPLTLIRPIPACGWTTRTTAPYEPRRRPASEIDDPAVS